jgi:hypothetical protein
VVPHRIVHERHRTPPGGRTRPLVDPGLAKTRRRADNTSVGRTAYIAGIVSLASGIVASAFGTANLPAPALVTAVACVLATLAADTVGLVALIANRDRPSARGGLALAAAPTVALGGYGLFIAAVMLGGGFS